MSWLSRKKQIEQSLSALNEQSSEILRSIEDNKKSYEALIAQEYNLQKNNSKDSIRLSDLQQKIKEKQERVEILER